MSAPKILATGRCVPGRIVTNEELSHRVDTSDEWIFSRTGIKSRHFCQEEQGIDLAIGAAEEALSRAGISKEEIGICVVATFSPDFASPSTACVLHKYLGLPEDTLCFDLNAACAGFLYALHTVHALLAQSSRPYALLLGCEYISRLLDMEDRESCILFGDGAAAAVVCREEEATWHTVFGTRGDDTTLYVRGAGPQPSYIHMDGKPVFRFAVEVVERSIRQLLEKSGCTMEDVDLVVCHQANARIIDLVVKKLGAPEEKFFKNMACYGNTSAASIPIALDELAQSGRLQRGMQVLCVGFGAGLTWAGVLFRW